MGSGDYPDVQCKTDHNCGRFFPVKICGFVVKFKIRLQMQRRSF